MYTVRSIVSIGLHKVCEKPLFNIIVVSLIVMIVMATAAILVAAFGDSSIVEIG